MPGTKAKAKFTAEPVIMDCPICKCHIVTERIKKFTIRTHLLAALLCLVAAFVFPYICGCYRIINHYCPVCESYLGTYPEKM